MDRLDKALWMLIAVLLLTALVADSIAIYMLTHGIDKIGG